MQSNRQLMKVNPTGYMSKLKLKSRVSEVIYTKTATNYMVINGYVFYNICLKTSMHLHS